MKNPLELIIYERQKIWEIYEKVYLTKAYDLQNKRNRIDQESDLKKLRKWLDVYDKTIRILNEINDKSYE